MNKIKIVGLGGLNETGKNLYVVEVNDDMFVFDCGMKFNIDGAYGVDYILPDFEHLINNRKKIKGLFISNAHRLRMGGVVDLLKAIPEIKVYGSELTIELLKSEIKLENNMNSDYSLNVLKAHKNYNFDDNSIYPVLVTTSIPQAFMYVLNTKDGSIVYSGDYVFDMSAEEAYATDLGKLAYVGKKGVLCLLGDSTYAKNKGYTAPRNRSHGYISKIIANTTNRIICTINMDHITRLQELLDASKENRKKLIVLGGGLKKRIDNLLKLHYVSYDKGYYGNLNNITEKNTLILVEDDEEQPFINLERIAKGYDKFLKLQKDDVVFITEPDIEGLEGKKAVIMDELAKHVEDVITMDKNHLDYHASKEDIRMLLKLLNPKYYMPISGEYRYQVPNADIAYEEGMDKNNIILKLNGEQISFTDGKLDKDIHKVAVDEILIDGKVNDDVGELVLRDRECLGNNGIVIVSITIAKTSKKIIFGPEIICRGFVYVKDNQELLTKSKEKILEILSNYTKDKKYIDYSAVKNEVREKLGKFFYKETDIRPIVITVIQEV